MRLRSYMKRGVDMKRSLLVQTLLDMATGSGGAKLEALVVDAAGTFDAGSGKGYNPVTVPNGSVNVLGEKGVVSNNSVVVTPKAQVVGGWLNSGETSGSGVGVTASELVSGTLNVSSDGVQDVTNYQNISVPSAGHSASAHKGVVTDHSIIVTPRSTATQGFVQAGTVEGTGVSVSASELVSGTLSVSANGEYDVSNYEKVSVLTSGLIREQVARIVSVGGNTLKIATWNIAKQITLLFALDFTAVYNAVTSLDYLITENNSLVIMANNAQYLNALSMSYQYEERTGQYIYTFTKTTGNFTFTGTVYRGWIYC